MAEQIKIKVHYFNDPSRIRYVTREAAGYLKPKWVEDEIQDQPAPQEKKVQAVAPVEDRRAELQAKYKDITGADADGSWNQARLHIEIVKAETKKKSEAEAKETQAESEVDELNSEVSEVEVTEAVAPSADKPKRKSKKVTA